MMNLEQISQKLPEAAKDIKLNLSSVLGNSSLTEEQKWGVAIVAAITSGHQALLYAILSEGKSKIDEHTIEDAKAAAAIMAMNNVYYRFRHLMGKEDYQSRPPRLRMNKLAQPVGSKANLELFCLAASAINNCESCLRAHEKTVIEQGLTEEQVHDAVRIAAVIKAAATMLMLSDESP